MQIRRREEKRSRNEVRWKSNEVQTKLSEARGLTERTKLAAVTAILFGQGVYLQQLLGTDTPLTHAISHCDQPQTYFRQSGHLLLRGGTFVPLVFFTSSRLTQGLVAAAQQTKIKENDPMRQKPYTELSKLQTEAIKQTTSLK
ncbi:hypothetical protein M422DRAFT_251869 [Sphaerobolus stellatus SS14]|uniref:Uncharacterized protein n=1 Tax=Sphaerobolus stellatus (strain SS14) TaxID=990650 RepID=A0A0C9W0Z2_SPHS4|nr:hypothetical protein M422DRAFT_251869 [Sphaerobolus stellatus SS14]